MACSDFIAGLTVGLMVVPQSIAYAQIAHVEHQVGLYTSFMGCFVYVLLGTSKDITIGPTAILSQIVASSIDTQHQVIIPLMTLMCGISQFALGFLELGILIPFLRHC
jgi:sodium-independent sulfate anion transporter 11